MIPQLGFVWNTPPRFQATVPLPHRLKTFNPHISCHSLAGEIDEKMGLAVPGSSALVGAILPTSILITSLNSMTSIY